ncbi:DUF294 nucleotidyltransferase-like domain-containing protein [Chondrinema litorale]|uniref:DUF294 nucleotidyltransferase-like domain-containing protein n=1 Tax=Chondrinema litorale TaxID=2994555 RepID=UPI0025439A17|nr:DUF294 nucleotidyltransferase-like domain-containing protein [Chondrinema litorale]UZR95662.1 DUF294 nucleotidyltransferase-like domain-containing protein [Chondrinema litorale]
MNAIDHDSYIFFKQFQPFNQLPDFALQSLCKDLQLTYYDENKYIFKEGDAAHEFVYVVKKGAVAITKIQESAQNEVLVDICEEGDILGLRVLLASGDYVLNAKVKEEALLYCIPAKVVKLLMEKYPKVSLFFAGLIANQLPERTKKTALLDNHYNPSYNLSNQENDFKIVQGVKQVITISPESNVFEAAQLMKTKNIGSLLITDTSQYPLGIITDADLRRKIVAENIQPSAVLVKEIMSSPVITVNETPKASELLILMAQKNIRHFCVTKDGTDKSEICGIISERDIVATQGNNPAVIIRKIQQSNSVVSLKALRDTTDELLQSYLEQETALRFVLEIITQVNDAIIDKVISLAIQELETKGLGKPPVSFCWLSLGSEGRKEQLLRTDQDNAILYENVPTDSKVDESEVNKYFLELGKMVTEMLYEIGFEKCPGDIMASNKAWCRPLESWKRQFESWILTPEPNALMHSNIFFDFRPVYGNEQLAIDLQNHIFSLIDKETRFLTFLANNAMLNPTPLSFFRNFIVEKGGKFTDFFDIKARALMPLSDAARVLAYHHKIQLYGSTIERFTELIKHDNKNADIYSEACMAFEILLRTRAINAFEHQNAGRYIDIKKLNKLQKQTLKNIFSLTDKLKKILKVRFRTDFIR